MEPGVWDDEFARAMLGKVLLVGLTYVDGDVERVEQFYGEVTSVDARKGILLRLAGNRDGEVFRLPADLRGIARATPGNYRLKSTGEIVENPDLTATWMIHSRNV